MALGRQTACGRAENLSGTATSPLLLAAKRIFDAPDFTGLLRATVVISMRFNVIGSQSTAEQERKYNEVAERIAKKEQIKLGPTLQLLRSIYPDDAAFRSTFAKDYPYHGFAK